MSVDAGRLALLALALALVVVGVQYGHYLDQPPTDYDVEPATAADARAVADDTAESDRQVVYHYENLSDTAQHAFQSAVEKPDGRASFRGSSYRASEFVYLGDTTGSLGAGNYYVRYEGDYYRLTTYGAGMTFGFGGLKAAAAVLVGLVVTATGAKDTSDTRVRVAALAGVLAIAATAIAQFDWFGVHGRYALVALGGLVAYGTAAAGWLATDRLAG